MLINKCIKCNKVFTTNASLQKHLNHSIECEKKICLKCSKLFKTKQALEKHNNRKTSCNKFLHNNTHDLNIKLQIIEEKIKLQIIEEKISNNAKLAKLDIMEKKKNNELEILQVKSNNMEKQTKNTLSILEKKMENSKEIELIKCNRKDRTSQIINIENLNINTQNIINTLSEKYITDNVRTTSKQDISDTISDIIEKFNTKRAITIYNNYSSFREITSIVLRFYFNNNANKDLRSIFYQKNLDKFFAILINCKNNKEIKEIDFDTYLYPIIKKLLDPLYDILLSANPKPRPYAFIDNYEYIVIKHEDMIATKKHVYKNQDIMKKYSTQIFDEDNTLDLSSASFFNELSNEVHNYISDSNTL